MARASDRLRENEEGDFYVDSSCIDCAVCRNVAPASFARSDRAGASIVRRQPRTDAERLRAKMALVSCPTTSIGSVSKQPVADAIAALPEPLGDGIHFVGFASSSSYGAQSYLVVRPEGNVLVDSPRASPKLFDRIEALGGVRWMLLTHRDDVADHAKVQARFGCTRVLHTADVTRDTAGVERKLEGDAPIPLDRDLLVVPVPGHTRGSVALLFRDLALFSGDHLFATDAGDGVRELYAARSVCWYSWTAQLRSLDRLLELDFSWLLPGHEGRLRATSIAKMREHVARAIRAARAA
jgi:glyoxylase-like metal-dependent hydrolase (beta-lactamase superfamily II)/ferredoxin